MGRRGEARGLRGRKAGEEVRERNRQEAHYTLDTGGLLTHRATGTLCIPGGEAAGDLGKAKPTTQCPGVDYIGAIDSSYPGRDTEGKKKQCAQPSGGLVVGVARIFLSRLVLGLQTGIQTVPSQRNESSKFRFFERFYSFGYECCPHSKVQSPTIASRPGEFRKRQHSRSRVNDQETGMAGAFLLW